MVQRPRRAVDNCSVNKFHHAPRVKSRYFGWLKVLHDDRRGPFVCLAVVLISTTIFLANYNSANGFELPKEVTPELRAACERDVRRLCVRPNSSVSSVIACVRSKFARLNFDCRFRLTLAGI